MRRAAVAENLPEDALPDDEIGCFYRYLLHDLLHENPDKRIALGELVRYALTAGGLDRVIARLQGESRKQLTPYLTSGAIHKMTGGMEDVNRIAQPCRELLRRCAA